MILKTRESLTPLPGQLVFPFMLAEPGSVERPALERAYCPQDAAGRLAQNQPKDAPRGRGDKV